MLFTRYIRTQKPYIDDYYFCVVKMEKGYTIAVGFVKKVHNRGFPPDIFVKDARR
jgi:hypothetical protein